LSWTADCAVYADATERQLNGIENSGLIGFGKTEIKPTFGFHTPLVAVI